MTDANQIPSTSPDINQLTLIPTITKKPSFQFPESLRGWSKPGFTGENVTAEDANAITKHVMETSSPPKLRNEGSSIDGGYFGGIPHYRGRGRGTEVQRGKGSGLSRGQSQQNQQNQQSQQNQQNQQNQRGRGHERGGGLTRGQSRRLRRDDSRVQREKDLLEKIDELKDEKRL